MAKAGFWAIESHTIRFGRDGRWYADDEPIVNQRIADLFARHITRGDDGAWWLRIGDERAKIVVDDTPFVVTRVDGAPAQRLPHRRSTTARPSRSPPRSLALGDEDVLYCDVKDGAYRARFLRPAQSELLAHVTLDGDRFVLPLPGGAQVIARDGALMRVALVEPEIPQNTGSVARLCAATETPLHLVGKLGFSLEDRYLKRAGLDYWPFVELCRARHLARVPARARPPAA